MTRFQSFWLYFEASTFFFFFNVAKWQGLGVCMVQWGCVLIDFYVFLTHTERGENVLKKLIVVYIQNDLTLK